MKVKIIGSGSAGNHIGYAFKNFSKSITMTDKDLKSLKNSKKEIYLKRYKVWNKNITQKIENNDNDNYDLIIISSPPKTHLKLISKNIMNSNFFLIEKPICEPDINTIRKFEPQVKIEFVKSKIMNNLSYDVSSQKFKDKGFIFSNNLDEGIKDTISLFKSINSYEI